jgi:hypothetical protein
MFVTDRLWVSVKVKVKQHTKYLGFVQLGIPPPQPPTPCISRRDAEIYTSDVTAHINV